MEIKDNFEELQSLKQQMLVLKQQLEKETIITDGQIAKVTKRHAMGSAWTQIALSVVITLNLCALAYRYFFVDIVSSSCLFFCLYITFILFVVYLLVFCLNVGFSFWQVNDGELQHCFRFPMRVRRAIPVSSIRYIEKLRKHSYFSPEHGFKVHIRYNKYDDLYLNPKNLNDFICDLIRENPDIELKQEK